MLRFAITRQLTALWSVLFKIPSINPSAKVQKYEQFSNFLICDINDIVEHYGKRIKNLYGQLIYAKKDGMAVPCRSALKRTPMQDFNSFSIMFCYIFRTKYQKIRDLFCPVIFLDFCIVWNCNADFCWPWARSHGLIRLFLSSSCSSSSSSAISQFPSSNWKYFLFVIGIFSFL